MRWVVSQRQVLQDQDHEPVAESPPQLNAGVRWPAGQPAHWRRSHSGFAHSIGNPFTLPLAAPKHASWQYTVAPPQVGARTLAQVVLSLAAWFGTQLLYRYLVSGTVDLVAYEPFSTHLWLAAGLGLQVAVSTVIGAAGSMRGALWRALPGILMTGWGAYIATTLWHSAAIGIVGCGASVLGILLGWSAAQGTRGRDWRGKQAT
jgi:hypothetical protein